MRLKKLAVAAFGTVILMWGLYGLSGISQAQARPESVPRGDIEVAWLHTTTSAPAWNRLVSAAEHLAVVTPGLAVDTSRARPGRTTETAQMTLSGAGMPGRVRIRWYKISGAFSYEDWLAALHKRDPAPVAVVGGGTSDRAAELVSVLKKLTARRDWKGPPPLALITTATSMKFSDRSERRGDTQLSQTELDDQKALREIYPATFRYCYHNEHVINALVSFVADLPEVAAGMDLCRLQAVLSRVPSFGFDPFSVPMAIPAYPRAFRIRWDDDIFSQDLAGRFASRLGLADGDTRDPDNPLRLSGVPLIKSVDACQMPHSIGTFGNASREEVNNLEETIRQIPTTPGVRSVLFIPTSANPARRVLRAITGKSPLIGRNLIAVTGDAIFFDTLSRFGETQWNIRDIPIPLVTFAHQNPADPRDRGPGDLNPPATDEVLLFEDILRSVVEGCAMPADRPDDDPGEMPDAAALAGRLQARTKTPTFDAVGDRQKGGEFVVMLRPQFDATGDGGATIRSQPSIVIWQRVEGRWAQKTSVVAK